MRRSRLLLALIAAAASYECGRVGFEKLDDSMALDGGPPPIDASLLPSVCTDFRNVQQLSLGEKHTCVILTDGHLWCWGANQWNQLLPGTAAEQLSPIESPHFTDWRQVQNGEGHICGIRADGSMWCWGRGLEGQLGQGDGLSHIVPARVGTDVDWVLLATGRPHNCGSRMDGSVWCWGNDSHGQMGQGTTGGATRSPIRVGTDTDWIDVQARWLHNCALKSDGELWCWGLGRNGELGNGVEMDTGVLQSPTPGQRWRVLGPGAFHTCAIRQDDTLWCWGANWSGQTGDGSTISPVLAPQQVGTDADWRDVKSGRGHTCAIRNNGTLWCWGANGNDQLGIGSAGGQSSPVQVGTETDWRMVFGGENFTCGLRTDLWCWGLNDQGQLGLGDRMNRDMPQPVCF